MTKNAVQRLQEIEKDIKTVISIFEISTGIKHGKNENSEKLFTQLSENSATECPKASMSFDKLREIPYYSQKGLCESHKKNRHISARSPKANYSGESLVTIHMKPNSPPSSRSMITMRESDTWKKQTDNLKEKSGLPAAKTFYNFKDINSPDPNEPAPNMLMTPSKTLLTASEILQKNNFDDSPKNEPPPRKSILKQEGTDNVKKSEKEKIKPPKGLENSTQSIRPGILKSKVDDSGGTRLVLVRKNKQLGQEMKTVGDHMVMDTSPAFYIEPRKTKVIDKMTNENSKPPKIKINSTSEESFPNDITSDKKKQQNSLENDRKVVFTYTAKTSFNQKMPKSEENEEMELWTTELYKKIERSNEKLEKMKVFKELALDIAKHLKNKYDDIQRSKEELLEKLQKLEKHNERLNLEVKEANETKMKLQQKIEGFMTEKSYITDDAKTQGDGKEEIRFKSKINKAQKQLSAEIFEKQIIEKIQRDRLQENRSDLITREILTDELQRLTEEKTDLFLKLNQTQNLVQDRDTQIEKLNSQIQELQKEVKNQSQNLKTKADAFQQTKEELNTLRKNFAEVESEVSEFKKKIENLETIHADLIHKISDYEGQLISNQKEINDLKGLNEKLEAHLESERDGMRIKNKIIDDQQETIRQLKEKADEAKNILKRNESLERILNVEREEKLELQEAVERLKRRKEELKGKIKELEKGLLFAPQEVLEDLKKTQAVLLELESQVQMKQNEWTMEQQLLLQAKEQACNVAEFATKKLMETTGELQRQSQAYKCLQRMVAEDLAMRKKQLRAEH